ncbi:autotransporter-associated beta strand repeat-containing protein, partial [bacterium]|nr:autotransporter-associated beta strand repeat-containing protein [bacterium]
MKLASGATLDLGGSSQQVGSLADSGGTGGAITNSGAPVTLTIGGDNSSTSFSGTLQGALSLAKAGTGTQTLSGNSTFAGDVLVQGGTLAVSGGADVIPDAAAVEVRAGATLSVSGPEVIGALRVDLLSAGTVTLL